jgi:hypothetical protein
MGQAGGTSGSGTRECLGNTTVNTGNPVDGYVVTSVGKS